MSWMFQEARKFNQDIGSWNTAKVTTMMRMFKKAKKFNQDLTGWQVSQITNEKDCKKFCVKTRKIIYHPCLPKKCTTHCNGPKSPCQY